MRVSLTPRAERDAYSIASFYERETGSTEWFGQAFRQALAHLQAFPLSGAERRDVARAPVRLWLLRPYHIVYRVKDDTVQVLAVIHSSRDMRQSLKAGQ